MTKLPEHVRKLVAEIETEIGEEHGLNGRPGPAVADGDERSRGIAGSRSLATPQGPVEDAVREILLEIGEDPDRQGLVGTPDRVHRMYAELTAGYHVDPDRLINGAIFDVDYSEMVVVKDIPFYSLCEHHLLPFFGTAGVAYIPRGKVIGLSKIPRVVEMYARRLQVQERMTQQVADFLNERLAPQGVGVVIEANHLCAEMRGIRKPGTVMTTSAVLGLFRTRDRTRAEFFSHLERRPPER
jgi:GTP cyclohydrolase I